MSSPIVRDASHSSVCRLLGSDRAAADAALDAYFGSLARLNGLTAGHHDTYWRLRDRLGPRHPESLETVDSVRQKLARSLDTVCSEVGITAPRHAVEELALVARAHVEPGPFAALSQHDTCPDQCILQDGRTRFFDFEYGWFGNALDDGVRARGNFATCWCVYRLPEDGHQQARRDRVHGRQQRRPGAVPGAGILSQSHRGSALGVQVR